MLKRAITWFTIITSGLDSVGVQYVQMHFDIFFCLVPVSLFLLLRLLMCFLRKKAKICGPLEFKCS